MRRRANLKSGLATVVFCAALGGAFAAQATIIQLSPTHDSFVDNNDINGNHGGDNYLMVGEWDGSSPYRTTRSYLKFDLSSIPPGQTIVNAQLYLYCRYTYGPPYPWVGSCYLANDSWQENSITWNSAPTGFSGPSNTVPVVVGWNSWTVTTPVETAYNSDDVLTIVMKFSGEGGAAEGCWFDSDEYATPGNRPRLEVEYSEYVCDCTGWCDLTGEGAINPNDVVSVVNYVYKSIDGRVQIPGCPMAGLLNYNGDWNCDGFVNPQDVVCYVNYVYKTIQQLPCDPCDCTTYPPVNPGDCPPWP